MSDPTIPILSTRPLSPALISEAAAAGISIDVIPFIATEPVDDSALTSRIVELGKKPLVVLFTSANAVEAVAKWTGGNKGWTVFCIGAATRRSVENHFGEGKIADTAESAMALSEKIIRWWSQSAGEESGGRGQELFFFCGDLRREELPVALQQAGLRVNELIVYRTMATPHTIERAYKGVIFFSPSAVESFFSINTVTANLPLFAIGQTTAAAIREHTNNPMVIAAEPDAALLIRQVIDHFEINK